MQTQTLTQPRVINNRDNYDELHAVLGIKRTVLQLRVALHQLQEVKRERLVPEMEKAIQDLEKNIRRFEGEVYRIIGKSTALWLERQISLHRFTAMADVYELMQRIGEEEGDALYDEFVGLLIDCFNVTHYAQLKRKNLHMGKYKALYRLFVEEVRRDTNKEQPQLLYRPGNQGGELWMRTVQPPIEEHLKED